MFLALYLIVASFFFGAFIVHRGTITGSGFLLAIAWPFTLFYMFLYLIGASMDDLFT